MAGPGFFLPGDLSDTHSQATPGKEEQMKKELVVFNPGK